MECGSLAAACRGSRMRKRASALHITRARTWADDAFGGRRFVSLIPLLTLPLAALLTRLKRNGPAVIILALIFWNGLSLAQYRLGFIPMNEALTLSEMTIGRLLVPVELAKRILQRLPVSQ